MTAIRAIIADDEKALRTYLRSLLSKVWPELIICAEAENGPQALELVEVLQPDIAFLDIRMPGFSGIEVAEGMTVPSRVVFITAFDTYAVEAFKKAAVDYLLKPVTEERLRMTVERLKKQINAAEESPDSITQTVKKLLSEIKAGSEPQFLEWIKARQGDEIRLIQVNDIYYFKAEDKYTLIKTLQGEHLIRTSIRRLEESLDQIRFRRVHRGTIVNIGKIKAVHRSLSGRLDISLYKLPDKLTVSRSYASFFKQM